MATIDIGKLTFTHKGDYNGSTAYVLNDVVYYNGSAYIAKTSTTGNLPTSTAHWNQFAAGSGGIWNSGLSLGTANQVVAVNSGATALEFQDAAGGGIAQVVQGTKTSVTSITGNSNQVFQDSGVSASITPSSTSSKVLIMINMNSSTSGGNNAMIKLVRGSTDIGVGDASGSRLQATAQTRMDNDSNSCATLTTCFLDSPNTTSETTYKVQYEVQGGTGTINITQGAADNAGFGNIISTITAMEVSA